MADPILFLDADRVRFDSPESAQDVKRYVVKYQVPEKEHDMRYGLTFGDTAVHYIVCNIMGSDSVTAKILDDGCYVDDGGGGIDEYLAAMKRCKEQNVYGEISELLIPFAVGGPEGVNSIEYDRYKFKTSEKSNPTTLRLFPYASGVTVDPRLKATHVKKVDQSKPAIFLLGRSLENSGNTSMLWVDRNNDVAHYNMRLTIYEILDMVFKSIGKHVRVVERVDRTVGELSGMEFETPLRELEAIMWRDSIGNGIRRVRGKKDEYRLGVGSITEASEAFTPNFEVVTIGFGYPDYAPQPRT